MTARVGLQLWTLRNECEADLFGTLERVAKIGYRWIEPYDFYGANIDQLARVLSDNGLGLISSHVQIERLESRLEQELEDHKKLNCKTWIMPWLEENRRTCAEDFDVVGQTLARVEKQLAPHGIELGYHNHEFEFVQASNPDGMQRVLAASDKLFAQLDTFWLAHENIDPLDYMDGLGSRLRSLHLKDGIPTQEKFTPTGHGDLDMPAIIAKARAMGVESFIVEQDETEGSVYDAIESSLKFLRDQDISG